jgi:hypothetical protein
VPEVLQGDSALRMEYLSFKNLTQFAFLKREAGRFARTLLKILLKHLSPNSRGNVTPTLVLIILKLTVVGQGGRLSIRKT